MAAIDIDYVNREKAVLIYFSHQGCSVCRVLKPKVEKLIKEQFPLIKMLFCNAVEQPDMAAHYSIFSVPTLIVLFDGKEVLRYGRNIGINQLAEALQRPYEIFFEN